MLVLSRKPGQRIHIGEGIVVTVCAVKGARVRVGVEAPPHVPIQREEIASESAAPFGTAAHRSDQN